MNQHLELKLRYPEVAPFVASMYAELEANSGKGDQAGWRTMTLRQAWYEISWHAAKLAVAIRDDNEPLMRELAADVANGSMMLVDILNQREKPAVHNHGPDEGEGLACREWLVDGILRGECLTPAPVPVVATTGDPLPWVCNMNHDHKGQRFATNVGNYCLAWAPRPEFGPVVASEGDKA